MAFPRLTYCLTRLLAKIDKVRILRGAEQTATSGILLKQSALMPAAQPEHGTDVLG